VNRLKKLLMLILTPLVALTTSPISAQAVGSDIPCQVFSVEDISSSRYRRARIFVATSRQDPDKAVALGYALALEAVMNHRLAFVKVLVTRRMDGLNRDDHSVETAVAEINFNPGNTPVIDTRLDGKMVTKAVTDEGELAVLVAPKRELINAEIVLAWLDAKGAHVEFTCLEP